MILINCVTVQYILLLEEDYHQRYYIEKRNGIILRQYFNYGTNVKFLELQEGETLDYLTIEELPKNVYLFYSEQMIMSLDHQVSL